MWGQPPSAVRSREARLFFFATPQTLPNEHTQNPAIRGPITLKHGQEAKKQSTKLATDKICRSRNDFHSGNHCRHFRLARHVFTVASPTSKFR